MFRKRHSSWLDTEIDRWVSDLKNHPIHSEVYATTLARVTELYRMKEEDKSSSVSKDTLAVVTANLLGILMVIKHEHVHVITSRAMSMLIKPIIRH